VRSIGVADKEASPTHGWRHTFKQIADRHGISDRVSDAITGHAPPTQGRAYGAPTLEDMANALKLFPRYKVDLSGGEADASRAINPKQPHGSPSAQKAIVEQIRDTHCETSAAPIGISRIDGVELT
jgi:hypothetical protein